MERSQGYVNSVVGMGMSLDARVEGQYGHCLWRWGHYQSHCHEHLALLIQTLQGEILSRASRFY